MRSIFALILVLATTRFAQADNTAEARARFEAGSAAYALGQYATAAQEYEKAFQLKPDPALLYNAAQAHRVAGNKQRALLLYQNYLRVYGKQVSNREEVERHIASLKRAIDVEVQAQTSPPTTPTQLGPNAPANAPASPDARPGERPTTPATGSATAPTAAAPASATAPNLTPDYVATEPHRDNRKLTQKAWFWVVIGGAVVVVAGVAIGLGVGLQSPSNPTPSLGAVAGN
jgi:tetratricopeptide (TPR) repeat protein